MISYNFAAEIQRSFTNLVELKSGNDPVYRATGLQNRAYRFPETGELVPYQLYVPKAWTPSVKWPIVIALHGANLDETNMLGRAKGRMQELAEKYGFIVAAPLGYRLNSGYGSERGVIAALGKREDPRMCCMSSILWNVNTPSIRPGGILPETQWAVQGRGGLG